MYKRTKVLFYITVFLIPLAFFIVLESGLRIFDYGSNTVLFIATPDEDSKYLGLNKDVARRYFYFNRDVSHPGKDVFLKNKTENSFRIFVMGGSTAAGYPYGDNLTLSRILQFRLSDVFPEKRIEMVNTALTAVNSFTLLDFMDEIIEQQPDAILIYAGHNEFYGALGAGSVESFANNTWVVNSYLKLNKFKTFQLLRNILGFFQGHTEQDHNDINSTLMERIVAENIISLDGALYKKGREQFVNNLRSILQIASGHKIPVIISELVSNIKDQKPFVSIDDVAKESADYNYSAALAYEADAQYNDARNYYYKAKDLDALRFRASEEFNQIIHDTAKEFGAAVVAMKQVFEDHSPGRLIGNNLILEHLHPNIDGYFLMADAFFNVMRANRLISADWNDQNIRPMDYYKNNWGITKIDSALADLNIYQLTSRWPFVSNTYDNRGLTDYILKNLEDTLALKILTNNSYSLISAHLDLAEQYRRSGHTYKAYKEYKALFHMTPDEYLFYEEAIRMLLKLDRKEEALPLLLKALSIRETEFCLKWAGIILIKYERISEGILFLEKAVNNGSQDEQLYYNLIRALLMTRQVNKADDMISALKSINPDSKDLILLKDYRKSMKQ